MIVSVIIPVYNSEQYLRACIDSVLEQSYTDFELLLINDGSPDSSGKICDEYALKDARVKVIHKNNGGVSSARNIGLSEAKGEWVCFIDSDDLVLPKYLEAFNCEHINPKTDLVIQGIIKQNTKGEFKRSFKNIIVKSTDYDKLFIDNRIHDYGYPVAKLFKTNIIRGKDIVFPVGLSLSEDLHFLLTYIHYCRNIQYINEEQYVYVKRIQSLSTTKKNPLEYFNRYFNYKHLLISYYEPVYKSFFLNQVYDKAAQSLVSTLTIGLDSLYDCKNLNTQERQNFYKQLNPEDLELLRLYDIRKKSIVNELINKLITMKKFKLADTIYSINYGFKSLIKVLCYRK